MTAKLISESDSHPALILTFEEGDTWTIGRDSPQSQLIIDDPSVTPLHATVRKTADGYTIFKHDANHPIWINDEEISDSQLLKDGDKIFIGSVQFRFSDDEKTVFPEEVPGVAEVHFGIEEEGRWLLKVVGGPNNGAEFFMKNGHDYLIGTDPQACDIILHDTSVSRRHAKLHISDNDEITIEDLQSRNGVFIKGKKVENQETVLPSTLVTVGTSSFIIYDREGDIQTIISPLLPSIVKTLQQEQKAAAEGELTPLSDIPGETSPEEDNKWRWESIVLYTALAAILLMLGYGTYSLFQSAPVEKVSHESTEARIQDVLKAYPAVNYSFDRSNGELTLTGHLQVPADKIDLLYELQQIKQIHSLDDSGLIIDEGVWREINSVLSSNPAWREISIQSPRAGSFIVTGFLKTRKQAEALDAYLRVNFPFSDILQKQIVVEEDVISQVLTLLINKNLKGITVKFNEGDLLLAGTISQEALPSLNEVIEQTKKIPGVKSVRSNVATTAPAEVGIINLSDRYDVTGSSKLGNEKYSVVVEGKILQEGDILDGMIISKITSNTIFLKKGETQYRINYK